MLFTSISQNIPSLISDEKNACLMRPISLSEVEEANFSLAAENPLVRMASPQIYFIIVGPSLSGMS
jgi:hypothetical protein